VCPSHIHQIDAFKHEARLFCIGGLDAGYTCTSSVGKRSVQAGGEGRQVPYGGGGEQEQAGGGGGGR
jgi:hypothetical protein